MTAANKIIDLIISKKAAALAAALLGGAAISKYLGMSTANPFALVFLIFLLPIFIKAFEVRDKLSLTAGSISGLIIAAFCFLSKLEIILNMENGPDKTYITLVFVLGFPCLFILLSIFLFDRFQKVEFTHRGSEPTLKKKLICFFVSMGVMLLLWLPYFLLLYPGDVSADSISELNQAWGKFPFSDHHPIAHTGMIRLFTSIGYALFHNTTKAVAVYSVAQMILLAAAFSYFILTLYKLRVRKRFFIPVAALYALLCYHGTYSVTMWKDIPFAIFILVFSVTLWRVLLTYRQGEKMPVFEAVMLFFSGIGVCLFRSNGLYAFIFLFVFMLFFCIKYKKIPLISILAAALVISLIVKGPVYSALNVTPPDTIESLSLPAQQISAVIRDDKELTDEQTELLNNVVDVSRVAETYNPVISDPIKNLVREKDNQQYIDEHKGDFLKLWIDLGLKYPRSYILAHICQTYGYWNPDSQYWVYSSEFRTDNFDDLAKTCLLPQSLADSLMEVREYYRDYHYLGLFWSIGLMTWIMIFMFFAALAKRKKSLLMVYLPAMGVWLTLLIATPVASEFRYAYSIFVTVPLLCFIPFVSERRVNSTDTVSPASKIRSAILAGYTPTDTENALSETENALPEAENAEITENTVKTNSGEKDKTE